MGHHSAYGPTILVSIGQASFPWSPCRRVSWGRASRRAAFVVSFIGQSASCSVICRPARWPPDRRAAGARARLPARSTGSDRFVAGPLAGPARALRDVGRYQLGHLQPGRLAYPTEAIPLRLRARALSTLGGTFGSACSLAAHRSRAAVALGHQRRLRLRGGNEPGGRAVTALPPDVTRDRRAAVVRDGQGHRSVLAVLGAHLRVLFTLGTGVMMISAARATRQSIIPLWADAQGLDAATISVIFGLSAAWPCCRYPRSADRRGVEPLRISPERDDRLPGCACGGDHHHASAESEQHPPVRAEHREH